MKALTAQEMQEVDRLTTARYGVPSLTLMENAGKSVAEFVRHEFGDLHQHRIVVLCGKGNNGGDGFVVARHLREMGANPVVVLAASPDDLRSDAAANMKRWKDSSGQIQIVRGPDDWKSENAVLDSAVIVIDALLGTGTKGAVQGYIAEIIEDVNRRRPAIQVVAVDIPSGLMADTGETQGAVIRADYTVTFTAPKVGMFLRNAAEFIGRLRVEDIGSPLALVDEQGTVTVRWSDASEFMKFSRRRVPDSNKGDYGHALIVAGSFGKSGAAVLASSAALKVGTGLVTAAIPEPVLSMVAIPTPEIMTAPLPATAAGTISMRSLDNELFDSITKGKRTIGIGPGLTTQEETKEFIRNVVKQAAVPVVLDADGLNAFAGSALELRSAKSPIAITPHPGEMARLRASTVSEVQSNRVEVARKAAADWNVHVVLKGSMTVAAAPDGRAFINSTGNPGMATGGTGDVLTGMLTGLTAQYGTDDWLRVLSFGVYLHGLAGDLAAEELGEVSLMASDIIRAIPGAYRNFYSKCGRA